MPGVRFPAAIFSLLAALAAPAMALGIGQIANQSALGQALQLTVGVRLEGDESLRSDCVAVEAQAGDARVPPWTLRWVVEPGNEPAERTLRIAGSTAIDEPVVTLRVHFNCSSTRLTREFVLLLDPPAVALARSTPPAVVAAPTARIEAAPPNAAPPPTAVARAPSTPPQTPNARSARRVPQKAVAARTAAPRVAVAGAAPVAKPSAAARASATGSRLKLEPAEALAQGPRPDNQAPATASAAASAPAAAASAAEDPAAAQARERLQALEENLARLTQESRATQEAMARMQRQLREAQEQRYANGLVYALGALAAALAAALALVLWKRSPSQAGEAQWWAAGHGREGVTAPGAIAKTAPGGRAVHEDLSPAETTGSPMMLDQVPALAHETSATGGRGVHADPELAVEELIDLEQQAEFFVVLGQDEAAIDLLTNHLDSNGAASPLPYLKLLEIHRRRGDREASERIRERFNRRFNAYAPEWPADPMQGRTLADYPSVLSSLQRLWSTPTRAMRALQASIFRRDSAASTFDLPAYRELLFLYSVARDLAEDDARASTVDLLLPIGAAAAASSSVPLAIEPPSAVDVDITRLGDEPADEDDEPQHRNGADSAPAPLGIDGVRARA